MGNVLPSVTAKQFVKLYEKYGSVKAVARGENLPYGGVHSAYEEAVAEGLMDPVRPGRKTMMHMTKAKNGMLRAKAEDEPEPVIEGNVRARGAEPLKRRKKGVTRYFFTSAQNNTPIFEPLWKNLHVLMEHYNATLHISRFAYIKKGLGARGDKAAWLNEKEGSTWTKYVEAKNLWWDERFTPYLLDERKEVAPGLVFVGDCNILPTKAKPLSGYQVLTGRKSGIFPHVKFAMESVATMQAHGTKFNYTTGTVTMRNYIMRDAGLKAEFHHCYGALLVEVNEQGDWWCRQINADSEGTIYDLDVCVKNGKLTEGNRIEALTPGDIHVANIDPAVYAATWGDGGLVDTLRPKKQFIHDVLDFESRSHHSIDNPHLRFLRYIRKRESVQKEITGVCGFLTSASRPWMESFVVDSNHDRHLARWLAEQDGRRDPVNAEFWLELQQATYREMVRTGEEPNHLQVAVRLVSPKLERQIGVQFIPQDGSYVICPDAGGGIECALHGDRGANGARGSAMSIAKMGRKANIGHSHSACIIDGVYQSGTSSLLKLEYNHGAGSWSHTHILTYPNGKRTLITVWNGLWRA